MAGKGSRLIPTAARHASPAAPADAHASSSVGSWLLILGCAFLLRAGAAVITERRPIFPPYYYFDANVVSRGARIISAQLRGRPFQGSYDEIHQAEAKQRRLHEWIVGLLYFVAGDRPLLAKLLHAAAGTAGLLLLGAAVSRAFSPGAARLTVLLCAFWPSAIFFSSQIFKDPLILLTGYGFLFACVRTLESENVVGGSLPCLAAGLLCLVLLAVFRPHFALFLGGSAVVAASWSFVRRSKDRRRALACVAGSFLALAASGIGAIWWMVNRPRPGIGAPNACDYPLLPSIYDDVQFKCLQPWNPSDLAAIRRVRLRYDRKYSLAWQNHEIGTQLFPNIEFRSWSDAAAFLPKGAFYVLFMPLPGLYPLDGRLGRLLAACENVLLLILVSAAALGIIRSRMKPSSLLFLLAALLMITGSAFFEFDLGSAARHKIFFLPLLFPFLSGVRPRVGPALRSARP